MCLKKIHNRTKEGKLTEFFISPFDLDEKKKKEIIISIICSAKQFEASHNAIRDSPLCFFQFCISSFHLIRIDTECQFLGSYAKIRTPFCRTIVIRILIIVCFYFWHMRQIYKVMELLQNEWFDTKIH